MNERYLYTLLLVIIVVYVLLYVLIWEFVRFAATCLLVFAVFTGFLLYRFTKCHVEWWKLWRSWIDLIRVFTVGLSSVVVIVPFFNSGPRYICCI